MHSCMQQIGGLSDVLDGSDGTTEEEPAPEEDEEKEAPEGLIKSAVTLCEKVPWAYAYP